jgi:TPR repeat protein
MEAKPLMNGLIRSAVFVLFLVPTMAVAQDYANGVAAYEAGDYGMALREWTPLAEQGNASAQNGIGVMYYHGRGVPQNYAEAVKWCRLAAEQGDASAQYNLGDRYRQGQGVTQDYAEAVKWYRLSAEQGAALAQGNLGVMYTLGLGVVEDNQTAHMWFNIAAANGNDKGSKGRDLAAQEMTPASIEEAQRRARVCMASNYKDCD